MATLEANIENRYIHVPTTISPSITELGELTANGIYKEESYNMCADTAMNFVATVVAATLRTELILIGEKFGVFPTRDVIIPYTLSSTPLNMLQYGIRYTADIRILRPGLDTISGTMLTKKLFGKTASIFLTGEFTGLIVRQSRDRPELHRYEKLWNDVPSGGRDYSYSTTTYYERGKEQYLAEHEANDLVFQRIEELMLSYPFYSGILTHACEQLGIPIEPTKFHSTIDAKSYQKILQAQQ